MLPVPALEKYKTLCSNKYFNSHKCACLLQKEFTIFHFNIYIQTYLGCLLLMAYGNFLIKNCHTRKLPYIAIFWYGNTRVDRSSSLPAEASTCQSAAQDPAIGLYLPEYCPRSCYRPLPARVLPKILLPASTCQGSEARRDEASSTPTSGADEVCPSSLPAVVATPRLGTRLTQGPSPPALGTGPLQSACSLPPTLPGSLVKMCTLLRPACGSLLLPATSLPRPLVTRSSQLSCGLTPPLPSPLPRSLVTRFLLLLLAC